MRDLAAVLTSAHKCKEFYILAGNLILNSRSVNDLFLLVLIALGLGC